MRTAVAAVLSCMVACVVVISGTAVALTVPVSDLVENGEVYSGQQVTVTGELIGDYGFRSDGWMWTQLNGDPYATSPVVEGGDLEGSNVGIGIRMPTELGTGLDAPGRYRTVGPLVEATGIWRYHDASRQGETFLDVSSLRVLAPGRSLSESPNWIAIAIGSTMAVVAGVVARMYVTRRDG